MKPKYSDYCGHHKITREPLTLGSNAPFFKDGKMNRDPHAAPAGPAVIQSEAKQVHIYHHRDKD